MVKSRRSSHSSLRGAVMRWIEDESEMNVVLSTAYGCVGIDSGRLRTCLKRLDFDEIGIESVEFANLVLLLTRLSEESGAVHVVLRSDPIFYFHKVLGRYPAFMIESGDSPEDYQLALGEKLREGHIDNLGTFWSECVVFSRNQTWFAHAVRISDADGGHLWIPDGWVEQTRDCYPWLTSVS